jgi:hypothetical protein
MSRSEFHHVALASWILFSLCSLAGAQSLGVVPMASSITIHPGDTNIPVTVSVTSSASSDPVAVALIEAPSGISASQVQVAPGSSGTLYLNAAAAAGEPLFTSEVIGTVSATSSITVLATQGSASASSSIPLTIALSNPSFAPAASQMNLPILRINTGGTPITSKSVSVSGTFTVTSANGSTQYVPSSSISDNSATFHLHGNSTILMPKLPYDLNLNTSADLLTALGVNCGYVTSANKPVCDKNSHYLLLANYDDKTMLRDWAASALALAIPSGSPYLTMPANSPTPTGNSILSWWAPHSLYVELFLNGSYQGTYQLIERVEVDSHRVNVRKMNATDQSGASLTGGYLLESNVYDDDDYDFTPPEGTTIGMEAPDFSPENVLQEKYISNYVDTSENVLFGSNFTDPVLGWQAYFDKTTLVNYYIVNELMGNVDGGDFQSSTYFYKDQSNPLIYMGPVWDFDVSSGNMPITLTNPPIVSPYTAWVTTQSPWYNRLINDPNFKAAAAQQFNALKSKGVLSNWISSIQNQAALLQQAQVNNFTRWPMVGITVWENAAAPGSYVAEVSYFTNWLTQRMAYMDSFLNGTATGTPPAGYMDAALDSVGGSSTIFPADSLQISGWAGSYTDNGPAKSVEILLDWAPVGTATLGVNRRDVAAIYGNSSWTTTGYNFAMSATGLSAGTHTVAALASDSAGLRSVSNIFSITVASPCMLPFKFSAIPSQVLGGSPFTVSASSASPGAVTYVTSSGPATISGATVTLTGTGTVTLIALQAASGSYCANTATTSFVVQKPLQAPIGSFDHARDSVSGTSVVSQADSLTMAGWAADYNDNGSVQSVQISIDGVPAGAAILGGIRQDVATVFSNSAWTNTGWSLTISAAGLSLGSHTVTAVATDLENLSTAFIAQPITVVANSSLLSPVGSVDHARDSVSGTSVVSQADSLAVAGWAADYNDNGPVQSVQILVDGIPAGAATLGRIRQDVATAYGNPAWANTGWSLTLSAAGLSLGSHTITAVATDLENLSTTFTAQPITVVDSSSPRSPVGNFDHARDSVNGTPVVSQVDSLAMAGWAADYNDNGPVQSVQIFIDGSLAGAATLGGIRQDVATAFSNTAWTGTGWSLTMSAAGLSLGSHTVTAVATDLENLSTTFTAQPITVIAPQ